MRQLKVYAYMAPDNGVGNHIHINTYKESLSVSQVPEIVRYFPSSTSLATSTSAAASSTYYMQGVLATIP